RIATEEQSERTAAKEGERLIDERRQAEAVLKAASLTLDDDVLGSIREELKRLADAKRSLERLTSKRGGLLTDRVRVQEKAATLRGRRVERAQQRDEVAVETQTANEKVQDARTRLAAAV